MLLRTHKISKSFFGAPVIKDVNFELNEGEICGIVGLNGAGKSTLIKLLSGVYMYDSGEIFLNDEKVEFTSPNMAQKHGIFTIYQEPTLVGHMTIMDNMFLGMYKKKFGIFVNKTKIFNKSSEILAKLGSTLSPNTLVSALSLSERYLVAIARAFLANAKVFIMDEPTAGLTTFEQQILYDLIRHLKKEGAGIIYITHRIEEVRSFCDKVMILRDGMNVCTSEVNLLDQEKIITIMSGRTVNNLLPEAGPKSKVTVLEVNKLSKKNIYSLIDFKLHSGEILGIAGSIGSGRTAILKTIFGEIQSDDGSIYIKGERVRFSHPLDAVKYGIGYLTDDRISEGILPNMNVLENSALTKMIQNNHQIILSNNTLIDKTLDIVIELDIKLQDVWQPIRHLSGGNQQKLVLGRWMLANCSILLLDEPTKGIDISTRNDIYYWIKEKANNGTAMIISSSDFAELKVLCDRIIVLNRGQIVDEMENSLATEKRILKAMQYKSTKN